MNAVRSVLFACAVLLPIGGCNAAPVDGATATPSSTAVRKFPLPEHDAQLAKGPLQTAVFAGGCFWGTQSVFERVKGVTSTAVGYAGGSKETATYDQVTTETTGHAESVQVTYDPSIVTYGGLLRIFFSVAHDPTQLNRQGPDEGTSYRSAIFFSSQAQQQLAQSYIAQLNAAHLFAAPIVTQVTPLKGFYRAEDYHQHYADQNPNNPYIEVCDRPKIAALKATYPDLFVDYKGQ